MKCSIMLHFIWVFTVCKYTHLGVLRIQRVNECMPSIKTHIRKVYVFEGGITDSYFSLLRTTCIHVLS